MANVFSFYQYEGTGVGGVILPTTNPYYTSYTGYYIPASVLAGNKVGFLWQVFDEFSTAPPTYQVFVSGEVGNKFNETNYYGITVSGDFSAMVVDSGVISINYTGEVASGLKDEPSFFVNYTGEWHSQINETASFKVYPSGQFSIICNERSTFSCSFTGSQTQNYTETNNYSIGYSGAFNKKDKDYVTLGYCISGISFTIGHTDIIITGITDTGHMNLVLSQVIFDFVG